MTGYNEFARFYDLLTQNIAYADRAKQFQKFIEQYRVSSSDPGILLDLACGTGTLTFLFEEYGYDVVGVDLSSNMLNVALDKKIQRSSRALFLQQDMTELDLYGTVDFVVCALDSLNHITQEESLKKVFERVSLFLNPAGLFLFDVNTPYKHRKILANNAFIYDLPEVFCAWQNTLAKKDRVDMTLDLFFEEDGIYHRAQEEFSERAYPLTFWKNCIKNSGMELIECLDADTGNSPQKTTQRLIWIARKK